MTFSQSEPHLCQFLLYPVSNIGMVQKCNLRSPLCTNRQSLSLLQPVSPKQRWQRDKYQHDQHLFVSFLQQASWALVWLPGCVPVFLGFVSLSLGLSVQKPSWSLGSVRLRRAALQRDGICIERQGGCTQRWDLSLSAHDRRKTEEREKDSVGEAGSFDSEVDRSQQCLAPEPRGE